MVFSLAARRSEQTSFFHAGAIFDRSCHQRVCVSVSASRGWRPVAGETTVQVERSLILTLPLTVGLRIRLIPHFKKKKSSTVGAHNLRVEAMIVTAYTSAQVNNEFRTVGYEMPRKGKVYHNEDARVIQAEEALDVQKKRGLVGQLHQYELSTYSLVQNLESKRQLERRNPDCATTKNSFLDAEARDREREQQEEVTKISRDGTAHLTRHIFPSFARTYFNVTSTLAQVWRAARISLHPIIMRSWCGCSDSPRLSLPLLAVPLLSYRPVHPLDSQLLLPRCGGQISCALSLRRTLAPLPSTTLSQVMSPTTTTSRRPLNFSSRNPPARTGP